MATNTTDRYYAILQAAETLFGEKGYQGVSIDEIARTAGVAKGLISYHFGNKEKLLAHVLSKGTAALFAQLDGVKLSHDTAKDRVRAAVEIYLTIASAGPALTRTAMMAVFDTTYPENIRKLWQNFTDKNLNRFRELVEDGIARKEFKQVDSQLVTQMVMAMAFEILRTSSLKNIPFNPRDAADQVTKILFEGICL